MLRFPNPGSSLDNFLKIFNNLCLNLSEFEFDLDDMVFVTVKKGFASSSGFVGTQAIKQSTRKDRSRDPLYNQLKMYSELYRHLGFIKSVPNNALKFIITPFGKMFSKSDQQINLFIYSILCISFPNESIQTKTNSNIRPFFTILSIINKIDNYISRDEMIICILSLENDFNFQNEIINNIKNLRKKNNINYEINKISKKTKIAINTLRNYTRTPIMFLRDSNLFEKKNNYFSLTKKGHFFSNIVANAYDLRLYKISYNKNKFKENFKLIFNNLFLKKDDISQIKKLFNTNKKYIFFNPYQQLNSESLSQIFNWKIKLPKFEFSKINLNNSKIVQYDNVLENKAFFSDFSISKNTNNKLINELIKNCKNNNANINDYINNFCNEFLNSKKEIFYPLINELFNLLNMKCSTSRYGVNNSRWDAVIIEKDILIPIEIKSPTEELYINVKGIRQALENKIILSSRYLKNFNKEITSLLVGYRYPNNRSDVSKVIIDIKKTFDIKIGVIDLNILTYYVVISQIKKKEIRKRDILNLLGFLKK